MGEWFALPLIEEARAATATRGDADDEIFHPIAERVLARCDACLRIGGPSEGADRMVATARELGKASSPTSGRSRDRSRTASFTKSEMMIVAAARELAGQHVCFVGVGLPNIAVNLAKRTVAPDLELVYEAGRLRRPAGAAAAVASATRRS